MLSPYAFVQHIKHAKAEIGRSAMASLALNLYYGAKTHPCDVSQVLALLEHERITCVAAITWVSSHSKWSGEPTFPKQQVDFLSDYVETWLTAVAGGAHPNGLGP